MNSPLNTCVMCGEPSRVTAKILGRDCLLCPEHWRAWQAQGTLAGLVAFLVVEMQREERR